MKIPVKAAKVNNSISDFSTNKMSIIFAKSKTEEGKYFVITVFPGESEGIPKASEWGDRFYVILPE